MYSTKWRFQGIHAKLKDVNYIFLTCWCETATEIKTSVKSKQVKLKDWWFPLKKKRKPQFRFQFPWEAFAARCPISLLSFTAPHPAPTATRWSEGPASLLPKSHRLLLLWDLPHCIMIFCFHGWFSLVWGLWDQGLLNLFGKFIYSQILAHGENWINELSAPANCYS